LPIFAAQFRTSIHFGSENIWIFPTMSCCEGVTLMRFAQVVPHRAASELILIADVSVFLSDFCGPPDRFVLSRAN
jgi:hypothetical protein